MILVSRFKCQAEIFEAGMPGLERDFAPLSFTFGVRSARLDCPDAAFNTSVGRIRYVVSFDDQFVNFAWCRVIA